MAIRQQVPTSSGASTFTPVGSGTTRTVQSKLEQYAIDVTDFGAVFDGATNVATAINLAITHARSILQAGNYRSARIIFPPGLRAPLNATLNLTGFVNGSNHLFIEGNGAVLMAATGGTPAIDAMGSANITFTGVRVSGQASSPPNVGVQFGRVTDTAGGGGGSRFRFDDCRFSDAFTLAAGYNFSGESCTFINSQFLNTNADVASYAFIFDGHNRFGIESDFVSSTAPVDEAQSFNQNWMVRCTFSVGGAGGTSAVVYRGGCRQHTFENCYFINSTGSHIFYEWCSAGTGGTSEGAIFDIHCETTPTGYFRIDGDIASPVLAGWKIVAPYTFPSGHMFAIAGSTVTSPSLQNLELTITGGVASGANNSFKIFEDASKWAVSGRVAINQAKFWNSPATDRTVIQAGMLREAPMLGPCDIQGSAAWAYSATRRLNQAYTGPIIRLRNGTTSALADFYAMPNGEIDISAISAFAAGAQLYVHTMYDQSGNGNNRTQTTNGNQPEYILSVAALNGKPGMLFTAGGAQAMTTAAAAANNGLFLTGGYLSFVFNQVGNPGTTSRFFEKGNQWQLWYTNSTSVYKFTRQRTTTAGDWVFPALSNGARIIDLRYSDTDVANDPTVGVNAVAQTPSSETQPVGSVNTDTGILWFGNNPSLVERAPNGHFAEDIAWKVTPAANVLAAIRRNQASFYNITAAT
jgi:hypothetical protein